MAIDDGRTREIISALKNAGVVPTDIEKEVALRNKWGRMQNDAMRSYTTEELNAALSRWA